MSKDKIDPTNPNCNVCDNKTGLVDATLVSMCQIGYKVLCPHLRVCTKFNKRDVQNPLSNQVRRGVIYD